MKTETTPTNEPFIDHLLKVCSDRGYCVELRRYWSPTTRHYAYPILGRMGALDESKLPDAITAALYAENSNHRLGGLSLGQALLRLAGGSIKADGFESFERHFKRLLACDAGDLEEVGQQLRCLLQRLERENISLDYNQLLWNLRNWRSKSEKVKIKWAKDFWQAPSENELLTSTLEAS